MSIETELSNIEHELKIIEDAKKRITEHREQLNKFNPFSIGEELEGNDWTHKGKVFVVDRIDVSTPFGSLFKPRPFDLPKYFVAYGYIKNKNGKLGKHRTSRSVEIGEVSDD